MSTNVTHSRAQVNPTAHLESAPDGPDGPDMAQTLAQTLAQTMVRVTVEPLRAIDPWGGSESTTYCAPT